jgi:ketosteroid isomerase-like protein
VGLRHEGPAARSRGVFDVTPADQLPPELREEYDAMSRKDWNTVFACAAPDFELKTPGGGLDTEAIRGVERARRAFEEFFGPYEDLEVSPEAFFEAPQQVVVFFLQRAKPSGSNAYLERRAAHVWTMRDGKAISLEIFPDRAKAVAAAGLSRQ